MSDSNSSSKRAATSSPQREVDPASSIPSAKIDQATSTSDELNPTSSTSSEDSSSKRLRLDHQDMHGEGKREEKDQIQVEDGEEKKKEQVEVEEIKHLTEKDVGISCYIESTVPAFEAVIKQRFSDFQVFEVPLSKDSSAPSELHITSLNPPPGELLTELESLLAEEKDPSLRAKRFDEEAERRANAFQDRQKQEAEAREFEKSWPGDSQTSEGKEINQKLEGFFGKEKTEQIRELWESGREVPKHLIVKDEEPQAEEGGRGDRGGRGGRGRGRGGKRDRNGRGGSSKKDPRHVVTEPLLSKESRTTAHQLIREIFGGRLSTETAEVAPPPTAEEEEEAAANGSAAKPSQNAIKGSVIIIRWSGSSGAKDRWETDTNSQRSKTDSSNHPPYIKFLLQKANRDSHDSLTILARSLGLHGKSQKDLSVAGTKDRRGVTVQQVTFQRGRKTVEDVYKSLNGIGREKDGGGGVRGGRGRGRGRGRGGFGGSGERKTLLDAVRERGDRGMRVAHLEYAEKGFGLGDLNGNKFVIALRNVKVENEDVIHTSMKVLEQRGFINYYGMQRFGTSMVSTHQVGIPVFKGQFEEACKLLLSPAQAGGDLSEVEEAKEFFAKGELDKALQVLPRNRVGERAILQTLEKMKSDVKTDWKAAFQSIPKTLRTMYVHAYQSYLWNRMVSARIERFGSEKAVAGDYVFVDQADEDAQGDEVVDGDVPEGGADEADAMDVDAVAPGEQEESEVIVETESVKKSTSGLPKVKILTEDEAPSTSILDVLMPMPGSEIVLEENHWLTKLYIEMLAEDGLTPDSITNSKTPEFALRGAYRKMIRKPSNTSYELIRYTDPNVALCQSDEDKILGIDSPPESDPEGEFLALLVRFTLGTSSYATMALREVLKTETSSNFQKEMTKKGDDQKFKGNFKKEGGGDRNARRDHGGDRNERGGKRDHKNGDSGWGDRGAHVNKVNSSKQRQWGKSEGATDSKSTNERPAEINVSSAATEAFRKAREEMEKEEKLGDE